ncbi:UNVERIFIED_CONTAM: hypothetical protein HDU68_010610, partial [Siphonaria sp. JEL0065]
IRADQLSNFVVRWIVLQLVFLGDSVIDASINFAKQNSSIFESKYKSEDDSAKANSTLSTGLNLLGSALGITASKDDRRYRESSPLPGLQPNAEVKKRSSSHGRQ